MRLETKRLVIFPLSYDQLVLYLQENNKLEEELNLKSGNENIPQELLDAFNETILPAVADTTKNYLYSTLWTIVSKEMNQMVADLCFKGEPNESGEIEIGYGTHDEFKGKGFMTEAIGAISAWAFSQPNVKTIVAETDQSNLASHRTLAKNNFKPYKKVESMIWWKLEKI
jgi:[ribosomal protein S5]-alanine N-acetyltransferase